MYVRTMVVRSFIHVCICKILLLFFLLLCLLTANFYIPYHAVPKDPFLSFLINKLPSLFSSLLFSPFLSSLLFLTTLLSSLPRCHPYLPIFILFIVMRYYSYVKNDYYRAKVKLYSGKWMIG